MLLSSWAQISNTSFSAPALTCMTLLFLFGDPTQEARVGIFWFSYWVWAMIKLFSMLKISRLYCVWMSMPWSIPVFLDSYRVCRWIVSMPWSIPVFLDSYRVCRWIVFSPIPGQFAAIRQLFDQDLWSKSFSPFVWIYLRLLVILLNRLSIYFISRVWRKSMS
jgi:hypothetical protein